LWLGYLYPPYVKIALAAVHRRITLWFYQDIKMAQTLEVTVVGWHGMRSHWWQWVSFLQEKLKDKGFSATLPCAQTCSDRV
jgi:hypothetical protein